MPKVFTYNAEFNPISFADRIAPLKLYKEEYDKQQEAYYKLLEESNGLADLENVPIDSEAYGIYSNFKSLLDKTGRDLDIYGLTPDVRSNLLKLRRSQILDINPLLSKQKKRADLVKEQRAYLQTHPESFFNVDYSEVPLTEIDDSSTYRPYDIATDRKNLTEAIYNSLISGMGNDSTDYDKIRQGYDYDNLNEEQQRIIDNAISTARINAYSAYNQYNYQNYLNEEKLRLARRGGSGSRGSGRTATSSIGEGLYPLPDGTAIKVSNTNGNINIKCADGKTRILNLGDTSEMTPEQKQAHFQKVLYSTYYQADYDTFGDEFGSIPLLTDKDGNHFTLNDNGDMIDAGPIINGNYTATQWNSGVSDKQKTRSSNKHSFVNSYTDISDFKNSPYYNDAMIYLGSDNINAALTTGGRIEVDEIQTSNGKIIGHEYRIAR